MQVKVEEKPDNKTYIYISGRIDTDSAGELRLVFSNVADTSDLIVVDFRDVMYISSAGLREFLVCRKRFEEDRLILKNLNDDVLQIFQMTGMDTFFHIESMEEDVTTYINLSFKKFLQKRVEESGTDILLKSEHSSYTGEDIEKATQIIAEDLSKIGVKTGSHVGICGSNSINWVLAFFAIQKLGALAMLINPVQSAGEIGRTCDLGDVEFLCYGELSLMADEDAFISEIRENAGGKMKAVYSISASIDYRDRFGEYAGLNGKFEFSVDPDAPCVVIFTSGSTGKPKGVILSSYNLLNGAAVQVKMQNVTKDDKCLLIVPLFHILGLVVALLPCAMMSAKLFIPDEIRTDNLIRIMQNEKYSMLHSVPTMIIALLNNKNFKTSDFASLRCTVLAGAATTETQIKMFREKLPDDHFMIAYGLSEMAPVSVTLYEDTDEHLYKTVGKPIENIEVKIVNRENGEECETGESGEIFIQGFNLMTGYYKVPIDEQAIDHEGWLHTGDMGYLDKDGYLVMTGRYKELIIRGGENIMPNEVADAVSSLPGIEDAKVVGVKSDFFGEEVCACIKLTKGTEFNEADAKAELKNIIAKYKIPSRFLIYNEFPLLANGKVDMVTLKKEAGVKCLKQ
ncbi:MAG: AMP-binding protein [Lachnospiraceae bacterium]|nr:AMP-binding protein [Lachnospiraceae bacterium]